MTKNLSHIYIAISACGVLLLSSCASSRNVTESTTTTEVAKVTKTNSVNYAHKVTTTAIEKETITAKLSLTVGADGKDISCNGTLRMLKDDVIQMNLSFLGFSVGTLEFTPEDVLLVDRINKQYVRAKYSQVDFLKRANVDFYVLQSLFWHELFIPGEKNANNNLQRFRTSESGATTLLILDDTPQLNYSFFTETKTALISQVSVEGKNAASNNQMTWRYADMTSFCGTKFPHQMTVDLSGEGHKATMNIELSALDNATKWQTRTNVKDSYTRRDANALFKSLLNL